MKAITKRLLIGVATGCAVLVLSVVLNLRTFSAMAESVSCPAEVSGAVLDTVFQKFDMQGLALNEMSGAEITKDLINEEQNQIQCIRDWAKSKTSGCVRSSYVGWMDYYQRQLNDAKRELASRSEQNQQTEYERSQEEKRRKIEAFEAKHPIPKPPDCGK